MMLPQLREEYPWLPRLLWNFWRRYNWHEMSDLESEANEAIALARQSYDASFKVPEDLWLRIKVRYALKDFLRQSEKERARSFWHQRKFQALHNSIVGMHTKLIDELIDGVVILHAVCKKARFKSDAERNLAIILSWAQGWTLQDIATKENLTIGRVQQIVSRHLMNYDSYRKHYCNAGHGYKRGCSRTCTYCEKSSPQYVSARKMY